MCEFAWMFLRTCGVRWPWTSKWYQVLLEIMVLPWTGLGMPSVSPLMILEVPVLGRRPFQLYRRDTEPQGALGIEMCP